MPNMNQTLANPTHTILHRLALGHVLGWLGFVLGPEWMCLIYSRNVIRIGQNYFTTCCGSFSQIYSWTLAHISANLLFRAEITSTNALLPLQVFLFIILTCLSAPLCPPIQACQVMEIPSLSYNAETKTRIIKCKQNIQPHPKKEKKQGHVILFILTVICNSNS